MATKFQVDLFGTTVVYSDGRVLKSSSRPVMSFDYDILTYTGDEKTAYKNTSKRDLTSEECTEVEAYLATIEEDTDLTQRMARNLEAKRILNQTDWYVIRKLETGVEIPDNITQMRAEARTIIS